MTQTKHKALLARLAPGDVLEKSEAHKASPAVGAVVRQFLSGRKDATIKSYLSSFRSFGEWLNEARAKAPGDWQPGPEHPLEYLLSPGDALGQSRAYMAALAWRSRMIADGCAPATINARLASLRSFVGLARMAGVVHWSLEVEGVRGGGIRDTKGPGVEAVAALLRACEPGPLGRRDHAIVRLLFDVALRRSEVTKLEFKDVAARGETDEGAPLLKINVTGKGKYEKQWLDLPEPTSAAMLEWLRCRGTWAGPVFINIDRAHERGMLSPGSIWRIVKKLAEAAGLDPATVRPHGLRHTAITEAAKAADGDVLAVRAFARHGDVQTSMKYIDNLDDARGRMGAAVAATAGV